MDRIDFHLVRRAAEKAADAFHSHLDKCDQCSTRPFDLCEIGSELLEAAHLRATSAQVRQK